MHIIPMKPYALHRSRVMTQLPSSDSTDYTGKHETHIVPYTKSKTKTVSNHYRISLVQSVPNLAQTIPPPLLPLTINNTLTHATSRLFLYIILIAPPPP